MIFIWNAPILRELHEILSDVQREALEIKGRRVFTKMYNAPRDIMVTCPNLDGHGGEEERTPSCFVNKETGVVHCFGCGYKSSLPGMIADILGLRGQSAGYRWLLRTYEVAEQGERPAIKLNWERKKSKQFLDESILEDYDAIHPYLYRRGLTDEIIDLFRLGYNSNTKSITFPMWDFKERLVFVKERPLAKTGQHYHIESGQDKQDLLYGIHHVYKNKDRIDRVYLMEGEFDVLTGYVAGLWALGLQGNTLYEEQLTQLLRLGRPEIVLLLDNDNAGIKGTSRAIQMLRPYFSLAQAIYTNDSKDPNELGASVLPNLPLRYVS